MKKRIFILFISLINNLLFAHEWSIQERIQNQNGLDMYFYEIVNTPEEYKEYISSNVFYCFDKNGDTINTKFLSSKKEIIEELLNTNKFYLRQLGDKKIVYIPEVPVDMETTISKEQLKYMWNMFENKYVAFQELKEKGLTKRKFLKIKTYNDLQNTVEQYFNDCHMSIILNDYCFLKATRHDEGCKKSLDPIATYYEKETANAYYVRFCNCDSNDYYEYFPQILYKALNKEYLILDGRSNIGGDDTPQIILKNNLVKLGFTGTIIVLQDNYSFSGGEVWAIFGQKELPFKCILIGTHSGGMHRLGNNREYQNSELKIIMWLCEKDFSTVLPDNYLGEGKGFEPEVWATTPQMKETLERMGVDTADIIFQ